MLEQPASQPTILSGLAALLAAIAWPAVTALFLLLYKTKIGLLFDVFTKKVADASYIKAGQIELQTVTQVQEVLDQAGQDGRNHELNSKIPESQLRAAEEVGEKFQHAPISTRRTIELVHRQIDDLAAEYEHLRSSMQAGPERTLRMNEVTAKLRALSIAARPLFSTLAKSNIAGCRLAAICILQVKPDPSQFDWLIERIMMEPQAFIMFHASVAVLEMVKTSSYSGSARIAEGIQRALQHVFSYTGGSPDQNTIDALNQALVLLAPVNSPQG